MTYTPDSAGRLVSAVDSNGTNYVTSATYNASSSLTSLVNGNSTSFAGITNSFLYNPRLQLCRITAYSSGSVPGSCTDAANHGNLMDRGYNYNLGVADNGNVLGITNYRDTTRSQSFTYDALNRLTSGWSAANSGAMSWGETYSIDPWGNLMIAPMANKAHGGYLPNASDVSNRPIGMGYDAAGNMTNYTAPGQYVYDAENRLSSTAGMSYTYDANGERVLKSNTSTGAAAKRYWTGAGNIVAEADGSGNLTAEYVYFGGKRVARIDLLANSVHYYLSDHLSSTSLVASSAGAIEEESDYSSFGTEYAVTGGPNKYKFTGKERDLESGLDYFGARYYGNLLGRFSSADWAEEQEPVPYADLKNPQSLNLYGYVGNNPMSMRDDDGHRCTSTTTTGPDGKPIVNTTCIVTAEPDPPRRSENDPLFEGVFHSPQAQRTWGLSARVTERYIGIPLIAFLTIATPGALEAAGPEEDLAGWINAIEGHHPIPRFLGGAPNQSLTALSRGAHRAFHAALRKELQRLGFPLSVGGRGGSAAAWARYLAQNPQARAAALQAIGRASAAIDSRFGTKLVDAVIRNLAGGSF